jgi:hypothetical protein
MLLGELELSFDQLVAPFQQPRNAVSLAIIAERSGRLSANSGCRAARQSHAVGHGWCASWNGVVL